MLYATISSVIYNHMSLDSDCNKFGLYIPNEWKKIRGMFSCRFLIETESKAKVSIVSVHLNIVPMYQCTFSALSSSIKKY